MWPPSMLADAVKMHCHRNLENCIFHAIKRSFANTDEQTKPLWNMTARKIGNLRFLQIFRWKITTDLFINWLWFIFISCWEGLGCCYSVDVNFNCGTEFLICILTRTKNQYQNLDWFLLVNPKTCGGGGFCPSSMDMACIPSIFIKTSQFFLVKAVWWQLSPKIFSSWGW